MLSQIAALSDCVPGSSTARVVTMGEMIFKFPQVSDKARTDFTVLFRFCACRVMEGWSWASVPDNAVFVALLSLSCS